MPFHSPFPAVTIPECSLVDYVLGDLSASDLQRRAVLDYASGDTLTYGELVNAVDTFVDRLPRELQRGDVVALIGPNSARWIVAYLGCLKAGLVVTPITTLSTADEIARQIITAAAQLLYFDGAVSTTAVEGAATAGLAASAMRALDDIPLTAEKCSPLGTASVIDSRSELAVLPFSSGTTGVPKGVMLSHHNLIANLCQIEDAMDLDAGDVVMGLLPFSHIYGMSVVLNLALRRRATVVVLRSFTLEAALSLIESERITHLPVAPPVMVALGKDARVANFDTTSVRIVLSGAAPLDAALAATVRARLGCEVRQAYGMTEMSPVSHIAPATIDTVPAESVGFTVANMTCKLVDPATGEEHIQPAAGTSSPGELRCTGPNVMIGYLDNPSATQDAFDDDGYLRTGDIAVVDASGAVTIVDRLKELIKYKGYQVAPAELEGILLSHNAITDAAVIGQPLGNGDEAPHAFVVRSEGSELTRSDVIEHVQARVAPYKKIREVTFVDVIPKSASGKILRRVLRQPTGVVEHG
ncbi:AMP-binding protein [Rhodococcoides kyotonense]|uniref:Acyl-CoA synthetase (AMP-forming)/AMP-acid ligase II n=1 Tax=Rhodococcoides kyotonense TaxID=398843 RepID=A0A239HM86_9NOCA|nr:AMP-binding protein [Rhodococcus kyotonensis]SNS82499.1 Acyl-CoA synthetase (AMP-forming)/AMP-acid ligase II [Rhodococcus kyotonensis]